MQTTRDRVREFIEKNPMPAGWSEHLNKHLPATGEVPEFMPLVIVKNCKDGEIVSEFMIIADQVCTEEQCTVHRVTLPDGVQRRWGDLVPELVWKVLSERIALMIIRGGMKDVPPGLEIQYVFPEREIPAGSAR